MSARARPYTVPCPDPIKGSRCPVCGAAWVCKDPWRKERTPEARRAAKVEWQRKRD